MEDIKSSQSWQLQLDLAKKDQEKWLERGKKIVKRYRDEREQSFNTGEKKYNILWSNIRTMLPAVYAKKPQAIAERRYKDQDPVGRCASEILQRCLQYEIDTCPDYDSSIRNSVLDRLLAGRGVAWVRFEQAEQLEQEEDALITDDVEQEYNYEKSPVDYVYWEDFRCSPARTWEEVTWVARKVYLSREEGEERFGEDFAKVPLVHQPVGLDDELKTHDLEGDGEKLKKAVVWEIWYKNDKTVVWIAEKHPYILDEREDPLQLDAFFPCPKPLFATLSTDTLIPVPDYVQYQDQAYELDSLTDRISKLVKACKVVGVYDASQNGVQRMLTEGVDNTLIPVDNWAAFGEKNGVKGVVDWLPLDMVVATLNELYTAREAVKQTIYEVTGLSDIIRGASVASETATAQQIKSQYASLRLKEMQNDVAMFASELLRRKAQIMCKFYRPETLVMMSGMQSGQDAQYIPQALQLLNSDVRNFRIEVASDSLVELDEAQEKSSRLEFLQAAGQFLKEAIPASQQVPELAPVLGEMLMFGIRSFKSGRNLEGSFESALQQMQQKAQQPQEPPPDPEMIKIQQQGQIEQGRMQIEQARLQMEQQKMALEQEKAQIELQAKAQESQLKAQLEQVKVEAEAQRAELERQKAEHDAALEAQRLEFERWKAELDANTKIVVAELSAKTTLETAAMSANSKDETDNVSADGSTTPKAGLTALVEAMNDNMVKLMEAQDEKHSKLIETMSRPRVATLSNGKQVRIQ
jgi:hypothetical protein